MSEAEALAKRTHSLLARAQEADAGERQLLIDEVVESHLVLARNLARRFSYGREDGEDLYQVACLALVEACHRFDPERPSFIGFAIPTITGTMQRHLRDHGWLVRPPRRTLELALKLNKQWAQLSQDLGATPDDETLAEQLGGGVTGGQVREARLAAAGRHNTSLDGPSTHPANFADPQNSEMRASELRLLVQKACRGLDSQDRELLRLRFYEEQSQAKIAAQLGVSQMQISRRLERVLTTLRAAIGETDDHVSSSNAA